MKRRSFLKYSSILSTPIIIGGIPIASIARNSMANLINNESDRVLVLIQLNGGNDGLSTLFPLDSYDNLANARTNIIIPENKLLPLGNNLALHPKMNDLKSLYDNAKINIIQNVGYPEQNRSHFRSSDIWHTGSEANQFLNSGWLGRFLDTQYPGYPSDYPNPNYLDPFALTIGSSVSETCQGFAGNFSMALVDPNNINQLSSPVNNEIASGCGSDQLNFLVNAIEKSNKYGDRMKEAFDAGNNLSTSYDNNNSLSSQLKTVARLISGGLKSKVYVVNIGGFDTHANQTLETEVENGKHAELLQNLSEAIFAFQEDLTKLGLGERVLGMTYSEFGRRIKSNFSLGTDHGDAAPLIVFGHCVNAGIIGQNPIITNDVAQNEGVQMENDFRSIYGSVLMDWFDVEESVVKELFTENFQYIPIANNCSLPSNVQDLSENHFQIKTFPNPMNDISQIQFSSEYEWIKISVYSNLGRELNVISNQKFTQGEHLVPIDLKNYPAGTYFVKVQSPKAQKTVTLIKM